MLQQLSASLALLITASFSLELTDEILNADDESFGVLADPVLLTDINANTAIVQASDCAHCNPG